MPEQIIEKIKKRILPEWKACFFSALIFGLIAHLYKITNWLPNWDSLVFRYDSQNMLAMGRWFLSVVCAPSSFYDLPLVSGVLAIFFHALGAVCICRIFNIKNKITACLVGAVVITFPTVASVLMYNYVADGYALAFLFSCIAVLLLTKNRPRYIASAVLIALSAGIYQAYLTVTITLLILSLILEVIHEKTEIKNVIAKSFRFLLTGVFGMLAYYLVLTVLLKISGSALLEYQGFNNATSLKGIDLFASLYTIKESFVKYFFDLSNGISVFFVINSVIFALTIILYATDVIKNKLSIPHILLLCFYVLMLPVGASVLAFVNSGIDYHNLMKMGFLVFYLLFILQLERTSFKCEKLNIAKSWTILCVVVVLVFNQVVIANVGYHKLNMAYEKSYGTLIRIADRIEQTDGADNCDRVMVIGYLPGSEAYSAILPPDLTGTTDGFIIRADDEIVGQSVLCSALNDYCGTDYTFVSGEEKVKLLNEIDADSIGSWPDKNSIFVSDNIIVIKLGDKE